MTAFRQYLHSFRLGEKFWTIFLIDLLLVGSIAIIFSWFGGYVKEQSAALMQGQTPQEIQQLLMNQPEQLASFMANLKWFFVISFAGSILLLLFALFFYSWSQGLIWNLLREKKLTKSTYWRWNGLNLALIVPLLLYGILFLIVKLFFGFLFKSLISLSPTFYFRHSQLLTAVLQNLNALVSFLLMLVFFIWIFLIYYVFTEKYKAWNSIGEGFHLVRLHQKKLWKAALLMLLTAIVLTLLLWPVRSLVSSSLASSIIHVVAALLFLAWMRLYVVEAIHEPL
ncbi:hypothetical protein HYX14_05645 [Candidatus Woesearchaeota archaeon]|nr:hypothetical protein [Candidatus Woesearchaeota archaeon]